MEAGPRPVPRQEERFISWKEIAAYLKRDVRTVQRWETTRGLPVHRLPGPGRSPIYALKCELEEWWARTPARQESPSLAPSLPADERRRWLSALWPRSLSGGPVPEMLPSSDGKRRGIRLSLAASLAVLVVAAAGWLSRSSLGKLWQTALPVTLRAGVASEVQLARLTFDSGVTTGAAISPDGKLVAYASDRSGEGNLDIWVQQINGRQPIRVTRNGAQNSDPSFSPDGARIAFRSERDGGGIHLGDSFGGPERKIAPNGYFPRFSPEGSLILFLRFGAVSGLAKMFLVSPGGGTPIPFLPDFSTRLIAGSFPSLAWSPDGTSVLFDGLRDGDSKTSDWWIAPLTGGPPVRTGAYRALPQDRRIRSIWAWMGGFIYFLEGAMVESVDAYRIAPAPGTLAIRGPAEQLTHTEAPHVSLSIARDGRMALVRWEMLVNPWSVAFDGDRGTLSGEPRPVVHDSMVKAPPVCSRDGGKMAYVCWSGLRTQWRVELHLRDLQSGEQTVREGRGDFLNMSPRLNGDGLHDGLSRPH